VNCPKCKTVELQALNSAAPFVGETALPLRCPRCRGFWVRGHSLSALHESGVIDELDETDVVRHEEDRRTGLCPEGHGILSRAKVAWHDPYYLERCSKCGGLWLDAGEWKRLVAENMIAHLDEIWAPSWRRELLRLEGESHERERLRERFGDELAEKLESLASSLASHPHRNVAIGFLMDVVKAARERGTPEHE
jgi:Zn-finger nucleic acid-binding protein